MTKEIRSPIIEWRLDVALGVWTLGLGHASGFLHSSFGISHRIQHSEHSRVTRRLDPLEQTGVDEIR